jgi:[ribosomal protein S5]-alanine N-acetyltransferase
MAADTGGDTRMCDVIPHATIVGKLRGVSALVLPTRAAETIPVTVAKAIPTPVLEYKGLTLREVARSDVPSLSALLADVNVSKFIWEPPSSDQAWDRFLTWCAEKRDAGGYFCWGVVPAGEALAVGLIQLRQLTDDWESAEWGLILGARCWGTGVSRDATRALLPFAFDTLGVQRLQARAVVDNGRAQRALEKLGAVVEETLPGSFERDGTCADQAIWVIRADEWRRRRALRPPDAQ